MKISAQFFNRLSRWKFLPLLAAVCAVCNASAQTPDKTGEWQAVANDQWKPIDQGDLRVKPGSALDFSFLVEKGEAGQHGFAFINRKGEFAFEKQPDVPVRFFCAPQLASSDSAGIEELAEQMRLAGYNVVRPHFLDDFLMKGSTEDLVFNPKALDTWERYTAALKKLGIYLCIDATTSWSAYTTISAWDPKASAVRVKSRLYYDPKMREHWEKGVRQLFEHVNPYTGVALKDEPQVLAVGLRNEPGFNFILAGVKAFDPDIVIPFRKWLKKNYATTVGLRNAWGTSLKDRETLDTVALPSLKGKGPDTRDLQRYFTDAERETFLWGAKKLRDMGVRVPVYDYNIEGSIQSSIARDVMPFVDNHAYSDHPSGPWLQAGQQITQENPVGAGCSIIRWITSTRQWGRPLTCTEWGNPFWNQWRHEGAFTVAAYAAFQNWQFLGQHASPIAFSGRGSITPFQVASDPPAKANERMAAFLFVRGDVQPSTHKVEVKLDANTLFDKLPTQEAISSEITHLGLVTGLGVRVYGGPDPAPRAAYTPDLMLTPSGTEEVVTVGEGAQQAVNRAGGKDTGALVSKLRAKQILTPANQTDVTKGIYQTDTGELLLDRKNLRLSVNTPRSQGGCFPKGAAAKIGGLEIENRGAPMSLLLTSLSEEPINKAAHLLLILSGDALNSGMTFTDDSRRELKVLGHSPVLVEVLSVHVRLQHPSGKGWKAWALAQNGTRQEEIPVIQKDGAIELTIQTGTLKGGPTPYFELMERE